MQVRYFLYLIFFTVSCGSLTTLKPGRYQTPCSICFESKSWTFADDGSFSYLEFSDAMGDGEFGSGNYYVKHNRIYLEFGEADTVQNESQIDMDASECIGDTCNISIQVIDNSTKEPIQGAYVILERGIQNRSLIDGTVSFLNGNSKLSFAKNDLPVFVKITYVGYETIEKKILIPNDYQLNCLLEPTVYGRPILHQKRKIKLKTRRGKLYLNNELVELVQ